MDLRLLNLFKERLINPFRLPSKEEIKKQKEIEADVRNKIKAIAQEAKILFQDQRYSKLKDEFKKVYEQNIDILINYNEPQGGNLEHYALKMREYQMQLRILKQIFDTPQGFVESEKKIDNEGKNKNTNL